MSELMNFELTKEFFVKFEEAIATRNDEYLKSCLAGEKSADIASILEELEDSDRVNYVLSLLDVEEAASIIRQLEDDDSEKLFKSLTNDEIAVYIDNIASDDSVDIINDMPVKQREEVITLMENTENAGYILDLMRYDEDSAGGLMAKELIKANVNWDVDQCVEEIRNQAEEVKKIYSIYVVDNRNRLVGRVSMKELFLHRGNVKLEEFYDSDVISIPASLDEEEVANIMQKYDLEACPVVNVQGKLLGRITIDDVVDVITEKAEEDLQMMAGIAEDVEEDDTVWMLTRARLPWLVIGLVGGGVGALFIEAFQKEILLVPAIAFFIPLIMATAGNIGIQSSTLIVQSLAKSSAFNISSGERLVKMLLVAIINGVVLCGFVLGFNLLIGHEMDICIVVSVSLFGVVVLSSIIGTITPIVLDKFKINPALASGPFITTANDLVGLAVYFLIAQALL